MKRLRLGLWLLILLLPLTTVQADAGPPPPRPLPPLRLPTLQANNGDATTVLVQLSPSEDAFIANGPRRIRTHNFGREEVLFVGKYDDVLAEMHTLVGYNWQPPANFLDIIEATLYFGVGDGADRDMPIDIQYFAWPFDENTINWESGSGRGSGRQEGVLGPVGYWYPLDVTSFLQDKRPHYIGFLLRSQELGYHFYKATFSREGNPALAPQLVLRYRIDNIAPQVWFQNITPWASAQNDHFAFSGVDAPDLTRPVYFELQEQLDGGPWQAPDTSWSRSWFLYPQQPGHILKMRLRGRDAFNNLSAWVTTPTIKLYSYDLSGRITDHRGRVLPPVDPHISPEPWWLGLHPDTKTFMARLKGTNNLSVSPHIAGYGTWEHDPLYRGQESITITLPAADNLMVESRIEDASQWQTTTQIDSVDHGPIGQGQGSLKLIAGSGIRTPALFCTRTLYDIAELNQPTVGIHFWYSHYPSDQYLQMLWQGEDGHFHPLGRAGRSQPYQGNWDNPFFEYTWADLTPYRAQRGRFCLEMTRPNWDTYVAYLDRFSLGSTPSDLSLSLNIPDPLPASGQPFPAALVVQNRSPYTATAQLHLTTGEGADQALLLPVIDPGAALTHTITLTVPAAPGCLRIQARVGNPAIDRTPADNQIDWLTFFTPYHLFAPLIEQTTEN